MSSCAVAEPYGDRRVTLVVLIHVEELDRWFEYFKFTKEVAMRSVSRRLAMKVGRQGRKSLEAIRRSGLLE